MRFLFGNVLFSSRAAFFSPKLSNHFPSPSFRKGGSTDHDKNDELDAMAMMVSCRLTLVDLRKLHARLSYSYFRPL